MYTEAIALLAAMIFGSSAIFLKKGYKYSSPLASVIVIVAVNTVFLWVISAFLVPLKLFLTTAAFFFIAGGLLGQGIARTFRYVSIDKVGASKTYTIIGASPLFAALFAIVFLDEKWTLPLFAGTFLVVAGIALLSGIWKNGKDSKKYLILPIASAAIYGFVSIIQKTGLSSNPNAIVGATTAITSAFLGLLIFEIVSNKIKNVKKIGKAWPFFIATGVLNSIAFLLNFEALRRGNVTVVMPLIGTQPLFVTILSFIFLKDVERITWKIALGAVLVVTGAAIITAF